jgi:hypothetical protein
MSDSALPLYCLDHVALLSLIHFTLQYNWQNRNWRVEKSNELSRAELLALKDVRLKGRVTDRALVLQLINDGLIAGSPIGYLKLTDKGRRMLVRGSPSLWDIAS